jgi:hypothetical protein
MKTTRMLRVTLSSNVKGLEKLYHSWSKVTTNTNDVENWQPLQNSLYDSLGTCVSLHSTRFRLRTYMFSNPL